MRPLFYAIASLALLPHVVFGAVSDATLQRKIKDLRNDDIPNNCTEAMSFLSEHAGEMKIQSALLNELYTTTDAQSKEECMVLLCHAPGFRPDQKFVQAVITRMHHFGKPKVLPTGEPAGDAGAIFLVRQLPQYRDLIAAEIRDDFLPKDNSLWLQYAIIRALAKAHLLDAYADKFSGKYLKRLAANLQDDSIALNARVATSAFIFLGNIGVQALREVPSSTNLQGRQLALVILSYLNGKIDLSELGQQLSNLAYFEFDEDDLDDFNLKKSVNEHVERGTPLRGKLSD